MNIAAIHPTRTKRPLAVSSLLIILIAVVGSMLGFTPAPVQAAPTLNAHNPAQDCPRTLNLTSWRSEDQLLRKGFFIERYGNAAKLNFRGNALGLSLKTDPSVTTYTASRITEIDSRLPILERKRCWQPTKKESVETSYRIRFDEEAGPPELIANLLLWNAPFPYQNGTTQSTETALPVTSFGVSRLYGLYVVVATQDYDSATGSGMIVMNPMPSWVDPTVWHQVVINLTTTTAEIKVIQKGRSETVLKTSLLHAPDPLGLQLSIDNDAMGSYNPINEGDQVVVDQVSIHYRRR